MIFVGFARQSKAGARVRVTPRLSEVTSLAGTVTTVVTVT